MRRRPILAGGLLALTLLATGCTGGGDPEPAPRSAAERLAAAQKVLTDAGDVTFELTSTGVPETENGVSAATGDGVVSATEPKFEGTITGTVRGVAATVDVIAVGEDTYLKLFTPDYREFDLSTLNAPNPATFFDPEAGLPGLLPQTQSPALGGQKRAGGDVLTEITGTLPGKQVSDLFHLGDGTEDFDVTYGLTEDDQLRTAVIAGPFFGDTDSTYTATLSDYGVPVEITRP
ncbi:LppX_LprAFG lipoprotein [Phycicoccus flavus]|uniref:LppX_LprAFG lipoprotein n=1 Tax=Phycicoccus flavus TaxID=2502783 RepID=UPI000FEC16D2|nr:LppX_LprAFG lipoprotein [Phycicoccus flavus]NHA68871.1 LppX_LprAFG lipoprotein [Phycicoccus flavus]